MLLPSWSTHQLPLRNSDTCQSISAPGDSGQASSLWTHSMWSIRGEASKAQRELGPVKVVVQSLMDTEDQPRPL